MKTVERLVRGGVGLMIAVLLLVVVGVALIAFGQPGRAAPSATLTVYVGSATVQRAGAAVATAAHSGEAVHSGDTIATGANSKAGVSYPDGSVTRLDSVTRVTISLGRAASGGLLTSFKQAAGLTWNNVVKLAGGSAFKVSGPNSADASVRGTKFGYYVEQDATGAPVIWIDTYAGVVQVSGAKGPAVSASANTRVTVRAGAAPTPPAAIPAGDLQLSFTVFNQAFDATTGAPFAFQSGTLSTGQSATFGVPTDGKVDFQLLLGWPGSTYQMAVVDPNGKPYTTATASKPPLVIGVTHPAAGTWKVTVTDVQSSAPEAWWVIASAV